MSDWPALLRVGTSSFSEKSWVGPFYSHDTEPRDMLAAYARRFDTVEIDATYYRMPGPAMGAKWAAVTPDGFAFALKTPKVITADKVLDGCGDDWQALLKAVDPLGPKLRFLLLQFGYFNRQSACPTLGDFLGRLGRFLDGVTGKERLVVEIRNPKWIGDDLLGLLRAHQVAFALTDQEWMPRPAALWKQWGPKLLTGDVAYVRFLGQRKRIDALTGTWDKIVIDRTPELRESIAVFREFLAQKVPVWAYFNNHYAGHAPASIELLKELWARSN
jgi:uncharacterized protein YecE (DUF72 family)